MLNEFFIPLNQLASLQKYLKILTSSSFTCFIMFRAASKVYQAAAGFLYLIFCSVIFKTFDVPLTLRNTLNRFYSKIETAELMNKIDIGFRINLTKIFKIIFIHFLKC